MGQRKNAVLQGAACALTCRMTVPSHAEHARCSSAAASGSGSRRPVVSVNIREHSVPRRLHQKRAAQSIWSTSPREKSYMGMIAASNAMLAGGSPMPRYAFRRTGWRSNVLSFSGGVLRGSPR